MKMVVQINGGSHKPKGLLKIANHIRNIHQDKND
jgi:hypothetical protein